jgi:hypothetical protein
MRSSVVLWFSQFWPLVESASFHGSFGFLGCILQQTGWTSNIDIFLRWLSSITFVGGGFGDGAVAEGLSEGLQVSF